jgi:hypothetical protein
MKGGTSLRSDGVTRCLVKSSIVDWPPQGALPGPRPGPRPSPAAFAALIPARRIRVLTIRVGGS